MDGDAHLAARRGSLPASPSEGRASDQDLLRRWVDERRSERIDYGYLIEAHTSGDIYVFFRDSNVLAVGDVASPARDPELDYLTGAWIGGRVDAMDRLLTLSDERTRIVPGYGPVMSRAELQAERDVMKTIYDRTVDRVRQGDYVDDMLKARRHERAGAHVEGSAAASSTTSTRVCGRITTSWMHNVV